jgi:hypothetical protein
MTQGSGFTQMHRNLDAPNLQDADILTLPDPDTLMLLDPDTPAVLDLEMLGNRYTDTRGRWGAAGEATPEQSAQDTISERAFEAERKERM